MRLKFRQIWSLVLCMSMVLSVLGGTSFAVDEGGTEGSEPSGQDPGYFLTNVTEVIGNLATVKNGKPFLSAPHSEIHTVFTVQFANAKSIKGGIKNDAGEVLYFKVGSEETHFYKEGEQPEGWDVVDVKEPDGGWSEEYIVDLVDEPYSTEWWAKTNTQHIGGIVLKGDKRKTILENVSTTTGSGFKENVWFDMYGNRVRYSGRLLDVSNFKTLNFPSENAEDVILDVGIIGSVPGDPEMYRINLSTLTLF